MYRVYSSLSVILQRDSQDKSPAEQYLQLKTGEKQLHSLSHSDSQKNGINVNLVGEEIRYTQN